MGSVHSYAEPLFWEGDKAIVCLLVHGFAGSPSEMRPLGEYLSAKGYGVSAPLLAGHGTRPEEMILTGWPNWYDSVEKEYLRLSKKYPRKKIVPMGLSMGGTLVLHLAYHYRFEGIVVLNPGFKLRTKKAYFAPILQYFKDYEPRNITDNAKAMRELHKQFYYDSTPIKSVTSQLLLLKQVKKEIFHIKEPILIIQSKRDGTLNPQGAKKIYETVASEVKKLVWLEKSGHIITLGEEKEIVFKKVEEFLCDLMT